MKHMCTAGEVPSLPDHTERACAMATYLQQTLEMFGNKHSHLVLDSIYKGTHTGRVNKHNKHCTWTIWLAHHLERHIVHEAL